MNFVNGFTPPSTWSSITRAVTCSPYNPWESKVCNKWNPPVKGEKMVVTSYNNYALENFGKPVGLQIVAPATIKSVEDFFRKKMRKII